MRSYSATSIGAHRNLAGGATVRACCTMQRHLAKTIPLVAVGLLAGCGSAQSPPAHPNRRDARLPAGRSLPPPHRESASGPYRFARPPLVIFGDPTGLSVYLRMNR